MGDVKLVTLSSTRHCQDILEGIWKCYLRQYKVDLEVRCHQHSVKVHQLLLEALSWPSLTSVERHLGDGAELETLDLDLVNYGEAPDVLDFLIEFLYRGTTHVPQNRLGPLREVAQELGLVGLVEAVRELEGLENGPLELLANAASDRSAGSNRRKRKRTPNKIAQTNYLTKEEGQEWSTKGPKNLSGKEKDMDCGCPTIQVTVKKEPIDGESKDVLGTHNGDLHQASGKNSFQDGAERANWTGVSCGHENRLLLKCPHCPYETRYNKNYGNHVVKHGQADEWLTCRVCNKKCQTRSGLTLHLRIHLDPEEPYECRASSCRASRSNLVCRPAPHLNGEKTGTDHGGGSMVRVEPKRRGMEKKRHECSECDYVTHHKSDLDKHVKIRHRDERPYACDVCGFRSHTKGGYARHQRAHTGEKPFRCGLCGQEYADESKLKLHLQRHVKNEKPFACHLCGMACARKDNLQNHLLRIHDIDLRRAKYSSIRNAPSVAVEAGRSPVKHATSHNPSIEPGKNRDSNRVV